MAQMAAQPQNLHELSETKGFKIIHIKIRSLLPKIEQLKILFAHSKIDVISVSETWLKPGIDTRDTKAIEETGIF